MNASKEKSTRSLLRVEFDSSSFERSHMKQPRGVGSWAFSFLRNPHATEDVIFAPNSLSYSDAKRWMRAMMHEDHEAARKVAPGAELSLQNAERRIEAAFRDTEGLSYGVVYLYAQP